MVLTGYMVRRLMRRHGVTIREIKVRYQVTMKRTRQVREEGVTGFAAEEWFKMIVGRWPRDHEPSLGGSSRSCTEQ